MILDYAQGDSVVVNSDGTVLGINGYTLEQDMSPLFCSGSWAVKMSSLGRGRYGSA